MKYPLHRRVMRQATALTALFGLTEPIFVSAQRTGFDIESLIFAGAIGGIGAMLYDILTGRRLVMMRLASARIRHSAGGAALRFLLRMYWRGVYQHLSWQRGTATPALSSAHP